MQSKDTQDLIVSIADLIDELKQQYDEGGGGLREEMLKCVHMGECMHTHSHTHIHTHMHEHTGNTCRHMYVCT